MGILVLIVGAVVALVCAWLVNSLVGLLSGDRPGGTGSIWWDIFSNMWRSPASYAEPLPDFLAPNAIGVGCKVRVLRLPLDLERSISEERRELLERCVGKVFRVEGVDRYGTLELYVLDDGSQAADASHHIVFIASKDVEPV